MKKNSKITVLAVLCAAVMLLACACGSSKQAEAPAETPTPAPTATPAPTPTPFPEPELEKSSELLTFDGTDVDAYEKDGVLYAKLDAVAKALQVTVSHENGTFSFPWRLGQVELPEVEGLLCDNGENMYIPVLDFCEQAVIGTWEDEEYNHLYCTPGAGDWVLPEGYNVPVMMYHQVGDEAIGLNNTIVHTDDLIEQFEYLLNNGYTPIWFEDLWNVENISKPVILVFDDGMLDNYEILFPIVKEYQIKVTIAPYKTNEYIQRHLVTEDQIREMSQSGLVAIESHCLTHPYLSQISKEMQYEECWGSRVWLTRVTGKQPIVLVYPYGDTTSYVLKMINEEHMYRFGVKMLGYRSYNTSDDPTTVWRFFPEVDTTIDTYAYWLQSAFPESN